MNPVDNRNYECRDASFAPLPPVFPISVKKCEKCKIFSGIFALKFCELWRFFSRQKPAFLFPAKNRRQPRFTAPCCGMSQKSRRKVAELRRRTFFSFFFFLEITFKPDENDEKIFGIFTLSLECSHYFRHFR